MKKNNSRTIKDCQANLALKSCHCYSIFLLTLLLIHSYRKCSCRSCQRFLVPESGWHRTGLQWSQDFNSILFMEDRL